MSRDFEHKYGRSGFHHQSFEEGGCFAFLRHRKVILGLCLLNAALLIVAVVLGGYCAKAINFQVPVSAAMPLIHEMNYLRNQSGIIRATLEARTALAKERASQVQLKLQVKQHKISLDRLLKRIETLRTEKEQLQFNITLIEENCARCPGDWILLKSSCYYLSTRHESNSKKNWPDSRADCHSKGAELLVINNLDEQQLLTSQFPSQSGISEWWEKGFWMGLTDVVTKRTWVWVNNVTEVQTMYWRSGQPRSDGPQSGNCAALFYFPDTTRMWYNGNCQDHQYNWICEKQASSI